MAEAPLSLRDVGYRAGSMAYVAHRHQAPETALAAYLDEAERTFARPISTAVEALDSTLVGPDFEHLRWFWLPSEIATELAGA